MVICFFCRKTIAMVDEGWEGLFRHYEGCVNHHNFLLSRGHLWAPPSCQSDRQSFLVPPEAVDHDEFGRLQPHWLEKNWGMEDDSGSEMVREALGEDESAEILQDWVFSEALLEEISVLEEEDFF